MNKRFFLIPLVILICLTSMAVIASDGAINKEDIQSNSAEDGFGYYVLDEKLGESITISFKDSLRSIQYTETLNLKERNYPTGTTPMVRLTCITTMKTIYICLSAALI